MTESRTSLLRIPVGTVLNDRYRIVGFLGKGGFAEVYECFDTVIERKVAVKVLTVQADALEESSYLEKLERFRREAKASARIKHNNVVTVFDMGVIEGSRQPYIVMEILEGRSLAEEIHSNGRVDPKRAIPLFIKALEALGEAHKIGVVHKDLKPSNLFLVDPNTSHESLKIVDFGIARFDEDDAGLTGTGQVFGTARYFAPEYISEQLVTPRLDVYQMGLILIEMLAGLPAVRSNNPLECVMCHGSGRLEIPHSLLDGPLGQVLLSAVSLDHQERYRDATEFQKVLSEVNPEFISPVTTGEMTRNLDEISSNMRTISGLSGAITAAGRFPTGPATTSSPEVIVDLSSSHVLESDDQTNPEPLTISEAFLVNKAKPNRWITAGTLAAVFFSLAIVFGVVIGVFAFSDQPPSNEAPSGIQNAAPEKTRDVPIKSADQTPPAPARTVIAVEEERPDPVPVMQMVTVTSRPGKAAVFRDGERVGSTPWEVGFDSKDAPAVDITIRRNGYRSQRIRITSSDGPQKTVILKKMAPAPSKKKITAPRGIPIVR